MANPTARWHGDNYQSRFFWLNAFNLVVEGSCVVEVTFEADGPKAFDDVVVRCDPPIARSGPERVPADYHQVKWHVETGGRFGYRDLVDPAFIGATAVSLLQNLQAAKKSAPRGSHFTLVTTYRISDGDPLAGLISGVDRSLLPARLFDGTGDRSKMGKVRKCWRDHLGLESDQQLKELLDGFRIIEGHSTLDELRLSIIHRASGCGIRASHSSRGFPFDDLARQLKASMRNGLTRSELETLLREEGLLDPAGRPASSALPVAIRSFLGAAADHGDAAPDDSLLLTDAFNQRYLNDGQGWQADIRPRVERFLRAAAGKSRQIRLILDAHASIAFLAGSVLHLKAGVEVELVQKGRAGPVVWKADDGKKGPAFGCQRERIGEGTDIAICIGATHDVAPQVRSYLKSSELPVGELLIFAPDGGPSSQSVCGGAHAAAIADQIMRELRSARGDGDGVAHIFAAAPNGLLFFLGQQYQAVAPAIVYEYDFDRRGNKSYQPSFLVD